MTQAPEVLPLTTPSLDCLTDAHVEAAMTTCERLLMESAPQIQLLHFRDWASWFPKVAGAYAVFNEGKLIYEGEMGSLSARMADFLDSRNHILCRSLDNTPFEDQHGFRRVTARERFPDPIEEQISDYIESRLTVTAVAVPLGRAEIEEHLTDKYCQPFNSKGRRGTKLHGSPGKGGAA